MLARSKIKFMMSSALAAASVAAATPGWAAPVVDGNVQASEYAGGTLTTLDLCSTTPCTTGGAISGLQDQLYLSSQVDGSDSTKTDLFYGLIQPIGLNDNVYGTSATSADGWPTGHKFSDLTGSDGLDVQIKNSAGTTTYFDFFQDYIAQVGNTTTWISGGDGTSGTCNANATGMNDGKINSNTSGATLAQCASSLQYDLNGTGSTYLTNSPPLGQSGWVYNIEYEGEVIIPTADAQNFTINYQHDSPPKTGGCQKCYTTVVTTTVIGGSQNSVPEPSSLSLLFLSLPTLLLLRKRRPRADAHEVRNA